MVPPKLDEAEIFNVARRIDSPDARRLYLQQACENDAAVLARVEMLLRAHDEQRGFLDVPAAGVRTPDVRLAEGPGTQIGPYKLLEQIGEGGFGVVFMAEQQQPIRRTVALKIIKPGMDTREVVARFEVERQALALMDHPNIGRVIDGGATASGRPYFVMDLVKGVPITRYCDDHQLTPRERLGLFADVCAAVQHAHQKGIIHRDLKPTNVLVAAYDGKPVPKLIDFGVAKALGQPLTERTLVTGFGGIVGTLEYMSPEQAEFNALDVDTRADIYSLGVLLYELLTGTTPLTHARLKEAALVEALRLIREEDPPKPSMRLSDSKDSLVQVSAQRRLEPAQLTREVRGDLDWIVMKCLDKDRNRRYGTAIGLASDLERYLHDEPVQARPPSVWYRCRKFARRNRSRLGVAALILVLLLLLAGAGWTARLRAAEAAAQAATQAAQAATQAALLHREISRALDETHAAYSRDNQPDAMFALKRAEALLAQVHDDEEPHQRVRQWRKDLEMVARLEGIRLETAAVKGEHFDSAAADPLYRKAFRDYGLDLEELNPSVAADDIANSAIKEHLIAALDDWMRQGPQGSRPGMSGLMAIARAADADPWRDKLRSALERGDGDYLEALAREKQVQSLPPASQIRLALALAARGKSGLAVEVLREAQRGHESDFWINHELGQLLRQMRPARPSDAVGFYRAALALRPGNPGVHLNLGNALREKGDWILAEAEFRAALRLDPDHAGYHNNLGNVLALQGRLPEAVAEFKEALRLRPDYAEALAYLGGVLVKQGQVDEAIVKLREATSLKPKLHSAHHYLGFALGEQKKFDEAIGEYQEAIRCNPNFARTHMDLGIALLRKERLDDAIAECREALSLDPGFVLARVNLGSMLFRKGQRNLAIAEFREVLRLDPKHFDAHCKLGNIYHVQGRLDSAIAEYQDAIRLKPDFANAHYFLGGALQKQGHLEQAAAHYKKALEYMPQFSQAESALRIVEKILKK